MLRVALGPPLITAAWLGAVLCLSLARPAAAQGAHFQEFPEFRFGGTLPGCGFGVTPQGRVGGAGPVLLNVPVAYTPANFGAVVALQVGSLRSGELPTELDGRGVNGTGLLGIGLGRPGRGWYLARVATGVDGEGLYSLQHQVWSAQRRKLGVALGVQDLDNNRARRIGVPGGGGRSFYAVVTDRWEYQRKALYGTLGFGNGRFNDRVFAGAAAELNSHLTGFAEYDGFGVNVGLAGTPLPRGKNRRENLVLLLSGIDLGDADALLWGVAFTYAPR